MRSEACQKLKPAALMVADLLATTGRQLSVREIRNELAEQTGFEFSPEGVRSVLHRLTEQGHVSCVRGIRAQRSGYLYVWHSQWRPPRLLVDSDRDVEDYLDAAALLAAGHSRDDVQRWTFLADEEIRLAESMPKPLTSIASPAEIELRATQIRTGWSAAEHAERRGGYRGRIAEVQKNA